MSRLNLVSPIRRFQSDAQKKGHHLGGAQRGSDQFFPEKLYMTL